MLKINGKLSVVLSYAGSLLSLAALLIFKLLPTSELANGIQYSGTDALWVLAVCPVLALSGAVCFIASFMKDYKAWQNFISKEIPFCGAIACILSLAVGFAIYLSYTVTQFSLGFVAPYTGTVYETLGVVVTMMTVNMFVLSTFLTIAIKRNNK